MIIINYGSIILKFFKTNIDCSYFIDFFFIFIFLLQFHCIIIFKFSIPKNHIFFSIILEYPLLNS